MADLKWRKGLRLKIYYKDGRSFEDFDGVARFEFCHNNSWLKISYPDNEGVMIPLDRIVCIQWEDICEKVKKEDEVK